MKSFGDIFYLIFFYSFTSCEVCNCSKSRICEGKSKAAFINFFSWRPSDGYIGKVPTHLSRAMVGAEVEKY